MKPLVKGKILIDDPWLSDETAEAVADAMSNIIDDPWLSDETAAALADALQDQPPPEPITTRIITELKHRQAYGQLCTQIRLGKGVHMELVMTAGVHVNAGSRFLGRPVILDDTLPSTCFVIR